MVYHEKVSLIKIIVGINWEAETRWLTLPFNVSSSTAESVMLGLSLIHEGGINDYDY